MDEPKKRRRLLIKWTVFELLSLERDGEAMLLTACASFTSGTKHMTQRWIRESGHPHCDYVILPIYQVEEV